MIILSKRNHFIVLRAHRVIDGTGSKPIEDNPLVIIRNSQIIDIGSETDVDIPAGEITEIKLPGKTILPGLIDSHVHLCLPSEGQSYLDVMKDSDGILLLTAMKNAKLALNAGITTLKDCGARNRVIFDLREANKRNRGLIETPRLLIAGRPITIIGGHFYFCNGQVDGINEIQKAIRQLLWEGADFIKLMSAGAAAYTPNISHFIPSFTDVELTIALEETHRFGKTLAVHCEGALAAEQAARIGVDNLEQGNALIRPDGTRRYDESIAQTINQSGAYVCPTIQTSYRHLKQLQAKKFVTSIEKKLLDSFITKIETKVDHFSKFHQLGIPLITGTDAGDGFNRFDDIALSLDLMVQGGMTPMEAILATTKIPAEALNMEHLIGTLEPGKCADIIAVQGNPMKDISQVMQDIQFVMLDGRIIKQ